jgi:tetratricopeptide (TPR) repeat protein
LEDALMKPFMSLTHSASLALALAAGFATLAAGPAAAQKKEKESKTAGKAPAPELTPAYRKSFIEVQAAQKAGNAADFATKLAALEPLAISADEKYYLGAMRFELSKLTKDKATTRKGINEMIASQSKLTTNLAELIYNAGALAYEAGDYQDALAKLTQADQAGSKDINRFLLGAEANFKLSQIPAGLGYLRKGVEQQKASGQAVPQDWYRRALGMSMKGKLTNELTTWSMDLVRAYPTATNWRDALVLYRDGARLDPLVQLDVFRLMRQTKALAGEKDFYDYAEVANARALPGEAKAVIEEGFANNAVSKTSKPVNEMLALVNGKIGADKASVASDEKRARASADGKIAANTGNAYLGYGDYTKAIELFKLALSKGGVDNDAVNTRLGIALAMMGQKEEARTAFKAVTGPQRATVAQFWKLYMDIPA